MLSLRRVALVCIAQSRAYGGGGSALASGTRPGGFRPFERSTCGRCMHEPSAAGAKQSSAYMHAPRQNGGPLLIILVNQVVGVATWNVVPFVPEFLARLPPLFTSADG